MRLFYSVLAIALGSSGVAMAEEPLGSASEYVNRGMQRFSENKIKASIQDFDKALFFLINSFQRLEVVSL